MPTKLQEYRQFLENKVQVVSDDALGIEASDLHPSLFPHQRDAVMWALRRGKALLAMSFGMGKTRCQAEIKRLSPTIFDLMENEDDNNSNELDSELSTELAPAA